MSTQTDVKKQPWDKKAWYVGPRYFPPREENEEIPLHKTLRCRVVRNREKLISGQIKLPQFVEPVFHLFGVRVASTSVFYALKELPTIWHLGKENPHLIEEDAGLHPGNFNFDSGYLTEREATPEIALRLKQIFTLSLQNCLHGNYIDNPIDKQPDTVRFYDKTAYNSLRIPFLRKIFPDAKFIVHFRKPEPNISSMLESWSRPEHNTYPGLPGWDRKWCYQLIPGWRGLHGKPDIEIATSQRKN